MPLWMRNRSLSKKNIINSLQERKIFKKTLTDSLINPTIQKGSKGGSCFALLSGSLTVEAALVLPCFLFAMVNILSLFLMFESYGTQLAKLHQSGRQLSILAYAQGMETKEQNIELVSVRRIKPLIPIIGYPGCLVVNGCIMHKWIGFDLTGEAVSGENAEEMVFLTVSGSVYHTSRSCSYLNPAVETVRAEEVSGMRNRNGEVYTACQTCRGQSDMIYITADGNRFHASITCSGLKRTVEYVPKSQAVEMGRHACVRCGG